MSITKLAPSYDLAAWRARIPILKRMIPLNNCSQAPQTERTRAAALEYLDSWNRAGMDWEAWIAEVEHAKAEFATLIGAYPSEIAVSTSVSAITSSVASALDYTGGRRKIVVTEAEFPTVGHVWLAHEKYGARIEWVPVRDGVVDPADYDDAVDEETLLVSACHAYYQNGFVQDLEIIAEKAHGAGALLYVDAYQSLGTRPIDVKAHGIDFLASGCLKFLMGIPGIAFLYVRPELVETLRPASTGWFGQADPWAFDPKTLEWSRTSARFDTGTPAVINAYICRAGMEVINTVGPAAIHEWTVVLAERLIEGAEERGLRLHGSRDSSRKTPTTAIVCPDGNSAAIEAQLRERGIIASARGPVLRLAPHFYNTIEDVDAALDALAEVIAGER